jgi:5-methylcytosine-specific restriction endonuclease McrA
MLRRSSGRRARADAARRNRIDYSVFAIPKSEPRENIKAREDRQHAKARSLTRWTVYQRDDGCCRRCGRWRKLHSDSLFDLAHAHEIVPRSAGGSDTDTRNVLILCWSCHLRGIHRQTIKVEEWFVIVVLRPEAADHRHGVAFRPWAEAA